MKYDIEKIKKDFPIFTTHPNLSYLDNAATSQTPQIVLDAVEKYYVEYRANIHRGLYDLSMNATDVYEQSRSEVANFIGASSDELIFTSGATDSSNMLATLLESSLELMEGDTIVVSVMEHHSSLLPLRALAGRHGVTIEVIPLDEGGSILDIEAARALITPRTKIVSVMLASNVLGTINPVKKIAEMAHQVGAFMISDATAVVGHLPVDVKDLQVDALFFSGHKMCGPTGIGGLYIAQEYLENMSPAVLGGGIVLRVLPDEVTYKQDVSRFEAGTPNIAGAVGLAAAVVYLNSLEVSQVHDHVSTLTEYLCTTLENIEGVTLYTSKDTATNIGIVSFTLEGVHAHDVVEISNRSTVALRAGRHCAEPLGDALGVNATVRASMYLYNTKDDIDRLRASIKEVQKVFK